MKFGAHAFVWIGDWTTDSGNHAITEAGQVGFDLIEIPLLNPDTFDAASHRATLAKAGIEATCSLALPADAHLPAEPEKARDFLYRALVQVINGLQRIFRGIKAEAPIGPDGGVLDRKLAAPTAFSGPTLYATLVMYS